MKSFIVLSALFVASLASPQMEYLLKGVPAASHFHTQDSLGQYAYGYNDLNSAKVETKSLDGVTRGSYSYVDPYGKLQTVEYSADALHGFRTTATNLPKAPLAATPIVHAPIVRTVPVAPITRVAPIAPIVHTVPLYRNAPLLLRAPAFSRVALI